MATSPAGEPLADDAPGLVGGTEPISLRPLSQYSFPRYCTVNTTTRNLDVILRRMLAVIDLADSLTVESYPSADDARAAVCSLWGGIDGSISPVTSSVFTKVIKFATDLGYVEWCPVPSAGRYLIVYPAGEAIVTDPDPIGLFAHTILNLPTPGVTPSYPWAVSLLRFVDACHRLGVDRVSVRLAALLWAPVAKLGPWGKEACSAAAVDVVDDDMLFRTAVTCDATWRSDLSHNVAVVAAGTRSRDTIIERLHSSASHVLPGAKKSRRDSVFEEVAVLLVAGRHGDAVDVLYNSARSTALVSHLDMVKAALGYLADVGFLANHAGARSAAQYSLTGFGAEALAAQPRTFVSDERRAFAALREITTTPFADRSAEQLRRFDEFRRADTTDVGRAQLADALRWTDYAGKRLFDKYEFAAVRAILALMDRDLSVPSSELLATYLRTRLGYDFVPIAAAPGGGPDAVLPVGGLDCLIEVTGTKDDALIKRELEPVTRHARDHASANPDRQVVAVLVCPSVSLRMVRLLLAEAEDDPDIGPGVHVVPLTEEQLRRVLVADGDLGAVLTTGAEAVADRAGVATGANARWVLGVIAAAVDAHS